MRTGQQDKIIAYLAEGPRTSEEVRVALGGVSPATLSRLVSSMEGKVLQLGKARATVYARPRDARGLGYIFPVFRVDQQGDVRKAGSLVSVLGGYYWDPDTEGKAKLYRNLPWFIQDMRPEGFMGRAFAHRIWRDLGLPERLSDWNDDHVLMALLRHGSNCMGDIIVGEESLESYFRSVREAGPPIKSESLSVEYPRLARAALEGEPAGSSAVGEQPKFAAVVERDGIVKNVLVKFSPEINTIEGRRWADLLYCEHSALDIVRKAGYSAAKTTVFLFDSRVFLESERFDRVGRLGRCPLNSLGVVDDEFFGYRDSWAKMSDRLKSAKMIDGQGAAALRWLSAFGEMIANTDMHFGNASLILKDMSKPLFELAPAYDMLPMLYRPRSGETTCPEFVPPLSASAAMWSNARQYAMQFWERAANDENISAEFRLVCAQNLEMLKSIAAGPKLVS